MTRHLNAQEVLKDIKSGMSDADLMAKYKLTEPGLQDLYAQMDRMGLAGTREQQRDGKPGKVTVRADRIVQDIRASRNRAELLEKYGLSERGLRWLIIALIRKGRISAAEVYEKVCSTFEDLVPDQMRASQRHRVDFDVPIYDRIQPEILGRLLDISDEGLRVGGLKTKVGDRKTLVVPADRFGVFSEFALDVDCRWVRKSSSGGYIAGFRILTVSRGNESEFRWLVRLAVSSSEGDGKR